MAVRGKDKAASVSVYLRPNEIAAEPWFPSLSPSPSPCVSESPLLFPPKCPLLPCMLPGPQAVRSQTQDHRHPSLKVQKCYSNQMTSRAVGVSAFVDVATRRLCKFVSTIYNSTYRLLFFIAFRNDLVTVCVKFVRPQRLCRRFTISPAFVCLISRVVSEDLYRSSGEL